MSIAINGRTWVAGELVGSADMNTIRDDLQELAAVDNVSILHREVSLLTITNTAGAALTKSIPGGTFGTDAGVILEVLGDYLYNSGGSASLSIVVTLGGTTIFSINPSISTDANERVVYLRLVLMAANLTNAQRAYGECVVGAVSTIAGVAVTAAERLIAGHHSCAEDSTGALTLACTVNTGSGAATFKRRWSTLRHLTT